MPPDSRPVRAEGPERLGLVSRRYRGIKGEARLEELFQHLDRARFAFVFAGSGRSEDAARARAAGFAAQQWEALPYPLFGRLYEAMDVLLVLSDFEGGPACLPEALGAGVPVASRPVGMVPEWLRDGDNGLILEDATLVEQVAALANPALLGRLNAGAWAGCRCDPKLGVDRRSPVRPLPHDSEAQLMHLLLPDTWHFHRRNFAALFDALAAQRIPTTRERSRRRWWKAHGNYRAFADQLTPHLQVLQSLDPPGLLAAEMDGINLWSVARSEFLCVALGRPRWQKGGCVNRAETVLRHAWEDPTDRTDLLLCLAGGAGLDRLLVGVAISIGRDYPRAGVFPVHTSTPARCTPLRSGGDYAASASRAFSPAVTFTLEERAEPLANNSKLRDPGWLAKLALPRDRDALERLRAEALRRLHSMRNKNVRSVGRPLGPFWKDGRPVVLVVSQVLNDFSLIETPMAEVSAHAIYRDLIGRLLAETDSNVIFKAHPWERRRPNLKGPVTLTALQSFAASLPSDRQSRLRLLESESIGDLFALSDHVVGLCSQGLLEAAHFGFKPIQLGKAFFGNHGFTHDLDSVSNYVDAFHSAGRPPERLPSTICSRTSLSARL